MAVEVVPIRWEQPGEYLDDEVYSNLTCEIDPVVVAQLQAAPNAAHAQHAAWDFCGYIWWDGARWVEVVWQHHSPEAAYTADTLEALVAHVCAEWGSA